MKKKFEITITLMRTEEFNKPIRYKYIKEGYYDDIISEFKKANRFIKLSLKHQKQATLINLDHVSEIDIIEIE